MLWLSSKSEVMTSVTEVGGGKGAVVLLVGMLIGVASVQNSRGSSIKNRTIIWFTIPFLVIYLREIKIVYWGDKVSSHVYCCIIKTAKIWKRSVVNGWKDFLKSGILIPCQYSCLGNPMDKEPGRLESMRSQKSWTWLHD